VIAAGITLGFHGCCRSVGESVLAGESELLPSQNAHDWLGGGIYFWEGDPHRALKWAKFLSENPSISKRPVSEPFVVGAIIRPGRCLDLSQDASREIVREAFFALKRAYAVAGIAMPRNESSGAGDNDLVKRLLDCAVFEFVHHMRETGAGESGKREPFDSIRAAFPEGEPLFEGAKVSEKSHVQICVRNPECILGYFRPIWDRYD
jgi:hypothetical protein